HALLTAHVWQPEGVVEHVQVVGDRVASPRVDDRDCLPTTVPTTRIERADVVGRLDRLRCEAGSANRLALRVGRGGRASRDELVVTEGWVRRRQGRRSRLPARY